MTKPALRITSAALLGIAILALATQVGARIISHEPAQHQIAASDDTPPGMCRTENGQTICIPP